MKLSWRGQQFKDLLWRCATATTVQQFTRNMEELKKTNNEVYDWLNKIPPQHWARSHFSGRAHCDVLLNNMCEVLNRQLVDGRDKLIITSLEFIREYLMKRIVIVQQAIGKSTGPLTPNATKIFNAILKAAAQYTVTWNGGDLYQACGPWGDKCVVNMNLRSCSCRKWELTGMPCKHAVAAIWNMAANGMEPGIPESWVHESYWLKTWEEMYRFKVNPVDGPDMWKNRDIQITLTPPNYVPPIGRPRKKRQKSAGELYDGLVKNGKVSRAGKTVTCGKCGQQGHNKSSCKGQRESANVRPKARKRTTPKAATPAATQAAPSQTSAQPFAPGSPTRFTKTSAKRLSPLK